MKTLCFLHLLSENWRIIYIQWAAQILNVFFNQCWWVKSGRISPQLLKFLPVPFPSMCFSKAVTDSRVGQLTYSRFPFRLSHKGSPCCELLLSLSRICEDPSIPLNVSMVQALGWWSRVYCEHTIVYISILWLIDIFIWIVRNKVLISILVQGFFRLCFTMFRYILGKQNPVCYKHVSVFFNRLIIRYT